RAGRALARDYTRRSAVAAIADVRSSAIASLLARVESAPMRVLLELSLVGLAFWSPESTPPPPGRLQPHALDAPWGGGPPPSSETEPPDAGQPQESVPSTEPPAEQPSDQPIETPPPTTDPVADPGDARPDGASDHEHLIAVEKQLGPKRIDTYAAAYGFVMANVVFDTGTVGPTGESPVFAIAGSAIGEGLPTDGQFLITARQSRFGFKGALQITERVDINGLIEVDFFGLHENEGPTAVIQPGVRMRLAKLEVG